MLKNAEKSKKNLDQLVGTLLEEVVKKIDMKMICLHLLFSFFCQKPVYVKYI